MIENVFSNPEVTVATLKIDGASATCVSTVVPGAGTFIHQVACKNGLILCGAFAASYADSKDTAMAIFAMPQVESMLDRTPKHLNAAALALGATEEMTGAQIMMLFCQP